MADDLVQRAHGAMDITVELGIAANVHDDMTGKPNAIANSIRRGIAEIERLRAEVEGLREQHRRDSAELRRLCAARDEQRDGRLLALERAVAAERERDALRARIEALVIERDHAQASLEHVIRHLGAIHMVMKPDRIRLPDGRIFEFNNPSIEREMLGALCDYIRSIPTVFDEARQARRPGGGR